MATDPFSSSSWYLTSRRRPAPGGGRDECVCCDVQGRVRAVLPLPARGHSFAVDTVHHRAVVFGRQPGFFAWAFSLDGSGDVPFEPLPLPAGHHFYGHGVFAPDGLTLYATENDYVNVRGVIGVYAVPPGQARVGGYPRIGEFDSGGIGPHDIVLMPDGRTLCVANGGLHTHPDFGKTILNLATMASSLVYLDRHSGRVLETQGLESVETEAYPHLSLRHVSLRHLALDGAGQVWAGGQYVNPDGTYPPLLWCHGRGEALQAAGCPPDHQRRLRNYIGSVAINTMANAAAGSLVAVSSPVGGQVLCWAVGEAGQDSRPPHPVRFLGALALPDVCGLAPWGDGGFLLSSGHGMLRPYEPLADAQVLAPPVLSNSAPPSAAPVAWDNHLRRI